jgi:hypothetical protein
VGASDGPIRAMTACGDRAAVFYAQHLDGMNAWVGLVLVTAAALLGWFMIVSGWAVLRVSVMAIWTTVIVLPTLWLGAIPGAPQRRAADVVWRFFSHGIQTLIYIAYVSVVGLAVERIVSAPLPAQLGGNNPFAHVLMMGGAALAALMLLRHIRTDVTGGRPGGGLWRQASSVAVGMGMTAAFGGAGTAAAQGLRGLRRRSGSRDEMAPWERIEAPAAVVNGIPHAGFDPVPAAGGGSATLEQPRAGGSSDGGSRVGTGTHGVISVKQNSASNSESADVHPGMAPLGDLRDRSITAHRESGGPIARGHIEAAATAPTAGEKAPSVAAINESVPHNPLAMPEPENSEEPSR